MLVVMLMLLLALMAFTLDKNKNGFNVLGMGALI